MTDSKSSYREMIASRVTRAANFAVDAGFTVEIHGSLLNISNRRSNGLLLFRSDHIVLQQITVDPRKRRHRYGSAMLDLAIEIANQAALRLELIAEAPSRPIKADLSKNELQAWYRRHKFVDADDVLMSRLPDVDATKASWSVA